MRLFKRQLHQVPVHVLGGRFLELGDSDDEEDGEEADVEADIDDCPVGVHPHRLWQTLEMGVHTLIMQQNSLTKIQKCELLGNPQPLKILYLQIKKNNN